ncbi:diguanylate cyclase/phosphodiesterase [alpha proteobacterium U9-1i]|nr:diguanylate cyclase/phosphodiesterase [alpha proteobacterium U9-1i]
MLNDANRTLHYKNDLRRLTAVIGFALACFGVVLIAVVAFAGWSANSAAVVRERQLVENALDQAVSRVLNEEKAIAWWDDAVINAQLRPLDLEWIETNFGVYFYETYGHDEIYIIDGDNRPVYANIEGEYQRHPAVSYSRHADVLGQVVAAARGNRDPSLRVRDGAFTADQARYSFLLGAQSAGWAGHILTVDGVPAVVTAMTIVPMVDANVLQGRPHMMVSVVKIDEDFMVGVGRTLLTPDLAVSQRPSVQNGVVSRPFLADDGAPLGHLTWTPRRPGQPLLLFVLPLVVLGVIGAGYLTAVMLGRLKSASMELASRERKAQHEAKHDQMSGLPNRRHFVERLQESLDDVVQARNNTHVVVAYIDVDRFKDINDTLGHQAGDALIMAVGARLRKALGRDDFLARFGGDEFAVLRRAAGTEGAADLSERLRRAFDEGFDVYGQNLRMTASIGIALAPEHGMSPPELMRHADIALYQGKNQGRDRVMVFCAEMAAEVEQRREIELELLEALNREELLLHYQPLINCSTNKVSGVEALLRWRHPTKGDISPAVFVPIAEEAGLMPALGAYVLSRAFSEAKSWPNLDVAINLSPVQFRHVDLVALLERLIAEHNVDPRRFVLEVTEGVLMESTDRNRQILEAIRALGFKIALDDFGTGYSSLRYLCDFRFDKIKIDRAFVTGVHERKRAMTIIQSVVTIGRGLGMDIVAEGVETEAEASVMRLMGVTELQGFFFAHAMPSADIAAFVTRSEAAAAASDAAPGELSSLVSRRRQ